MVSRFFYPANASIPHISDVASCHHNVECAICANVKAQQVPRRPPSRGGKDRALTSLVRSCIRATARPPLHLAAVLPKDAVRQAAAASPTETARAAPRGAPASPSDDVAVRCSPALRAGSRPREQPPLVLDARRGLRLPHQPGGVEHQRLRFPQARQVPLLTARDDHIIALAALLLEDRRHHHLLRFRHPLRGNEVYQMIEKCYRR